MSSSKNIFLLRHGSTDYNTRHLMQGHVDIPLNENGLFQAEDASGFFSQLTLDEIYSSPLVRAAKTAELVNRSHNLDINFIDEFKEMSMGDWEGKDYFLLKEQHPDFFIKWRNDVNLKLPAGESYSDLYTRIKPAVDKIMVSRKKNILIVAHSAVNRMILGAMASMNLLSARGFIMSNCGISGIKIFDDNPYSCTIEFWNRTEHLKERN